MVIKEVFNADKPTKLTLQYKRKYTTIQSYDLTLKSLN